MHLPRPRRRLSPLALLLPLLLATSALTLNACQSLTAGKAAPPSALQTFDTLYANAVSADDLVIKTATAALATGSITAAQAQKILNVTDAVKAALDAANAAAQLGNTATANGNLASALGPIAILSACLTAKPLTTATFAACATKLAPPVQS